jgi:hypothetical protein
VTVEHVEVLVEEASMECALNILLPQMLGRSTFRVYPYPGKPALLKRLPQRLAGYQEIIQPNWLVLIVLDRDDDDCLALKRRVEAMAADAGLGTPSRPSRQGVEVVTRIAIEELESWFFGDWHAVQCAYPGVAASVPQSRGYRDPDAIRGGTWEALERKLQRAGYARGGLAKLDAAERIARHMVADRNISRSFQALRSKLQELCSS